MKDLTKKAIKKLSSYPKLFKFLKKSKVWIQRRVFFVLKLFKNEKAIIYDKRFFQQNIKTNVPIASAMVNTLMRYFSPKSVVDVGCGTAEYLSEFLKRGVRVKGYEGSKAAIELALIDRKFIEEFDLQESILSTDKFDLALCLEVAEHIEKKFSKTLIENLSKLSNTVVFTAAHPGQGGHFHINEQPRSYWVDLWKGQGYSYSTKLSEDIKKELESNKVLEWYYENLMVFKKV